MRIGLTLTLALTACGGFVTNPLGNDDLTGSHTDTADTNGNGGSGGGGHTAEPTDTYLPDTGFDTDSGTSNGGSGGSGGPTTPQTCSYTDAGFGGNVSGPGSGTFTPFGFDLYGFAVLGDDANLHDFQLDDGTGAESVQGVVIVTIYKGDKTNPAIACNVWFDLAPRATRHTGTLTGSNGETIADAWDIDLTPSTAHEQTDTGTACPQIAQAWANSYSLGSRDPRVLANAALGGSLTLGFGPWPSGTELDVDIQSDPLLAANASTFNAMFINRGTGMDAVGFVRNVTPDQCDILKTDSAGTPTAGYNTRVANGQIRGKFISFQSAYYWSW